MENIEIWKDIEGYAGKYQISNQGRVFSVVRNQYKSLRKDKDGYFRATLTDTSGKNRVEPIHRLVANAFIEKKEGCNVVNHLDSNRQNNCVDNLEWTTILGNNRHAWEHRQKTERKKHMKKMTQASLPSCINYYEVYKDEELIGTFRGLKETAATIGVNEKTVRNCVRENRLSRKGYRFVCLGGDCRVRH